MDNVHCMEKATRWRDAEDKGSTYRSLIKHDMHVMGPGWTLDINWQDSSKRAGNPKTLRKESDVPVTLHVSKVGQSKEKGKTKKATLISDLEVRTLFGRFVWSGFNIYDTNPSFPRFEDQSRTEGVPTQPGHTRFTCLEHIYTQFFRIVYLGCLKMVITRTSAKIHFTTKLNLVN